MPVNT